MHLLVFKPKSEEVVSDEYLCDCPSCLNLDFDQCDQIDTDLVINMSEQDNRSLDNEEDEEQKLFEFVDVPLFGSLITANMFSPLYHVKIIEKWIAEEEIFIEKCLFRKREPYFKGWCLHLTPSRGPRLQFEIETRPNDDEVFFPLDEMFEPFVQVDESLTMHRNECKAVLERAQMDCY